MQFFVANNIDFRILPLPTNEANKDFDLVFHIAAELEAFHLNRCAVPALSRSSACDLRPSILALRAIDECKSAQP